MKLNKKELQKTQYEFNSVSNRLLQADYRDYFDVLCKFLNFIKNTQIIYDYIENCGMCDFDLHEEVHCVQISFGQKIFSTGDTDIEEVRNVYAILKYLVDIKNPIYCSVARGYSSSSHYQDMIKGFNERFVMILIRHIECYLTKVGIDMGLNDNVIYNVTVDKGQAIIATDNAVVTATNNVGIDSDELKRLITNIQSTLQNFCEEDRQTISECIEVIESEAAVKKPRKSMLNTAVSNLRVLKGTAEFGAAVTELIQFIKPLID